MTSTMNMSGMSSMASMSSTATAAASTPSSTGMSMSMSMDDASTCKISMLWNWYTIDACFLSPSWHIKSNGMFAATCIGIILLVISLELMRRISKEYDSAIQRKFQHAVASQRIGFKQATNYSSSPHLTSSNVQHHQHQMVVYRATPLQQLIRSILHAVTFGIAYIIMLLAMYYNGYIIICIFVGAGLGKFICDWMVLKVPIVAAGMVGDVKTDGAGVGVVTSACEDPTVCCG